MDCLSTGRSCAEAADLLAAHAPHAFDPALTRVFSALLSDMGARFDVYERAAKIGAPFLNELHAAMASLDHFQTATRHALHDWIFNAFEAAAVLTREVMLRNGENRPSQTEVMDYFVNSGHWLPDDSTLVAEYFYRKLPALLEKTGAGENDNGEGS